MTVNCLVLEYAVYGELFDFVVKSKLSESLALYMFKQILKAVHAIHSNGLAHLDLKIDNIFMGDDFTLKVADFGFAIDN